MGRPSSEETGRLLARFVGERDDDGFVFAGLNTAVNHQTVYRFWKEEGAAKGPLCLSIWAWADMGYKTKKIWKRLASYIDEDKRSDYNNGLFKKENVIKEIKRRLKEYGPFGLIGGTSITSSPWR